MNKKQEIDNYGYQIYCTIHLMECNKIMPTEAACDERYSLAEQVYSDYLQSAYALPTKSEFDCIEHYIHALVDANKATN